VLTVIKRRTEVFSGDEIPKKPYGAIQKKKGTTGGSGRQKVFEKRVQQRQEPKLQLRREESKGITQQEVKD